MSGFGVAGVVAITAILYGGLIAARLAYHHWDPSFFVVAGDDFCQPQLVPKGLLVNPGDGYDGQFYYRLALNPFTKVQFGYGIALDNPPYRQQRILYPILAHLIALGHADWVPWSMLLVNYLAVCLLAFSAGRLAELFGIPSLYGLLLPFYPGILLALDRDLGDVLSISLIVTSLFLFHSRRTPLAVVTLTLALLTRETVAILAGVLLLESFRCAVRGRSHWKETFLWMIPPAAYAAWQLWLFATWGKVAALQRLGNDPNANISPGGLPFSGLRSTLSRGFQLASARQPLLLGELLFVAAIAMLAAAVIFRSSVEPGLKFAWLVYLLLIAMLSQEVWVEDWAFLRGTADLMMLSLIIVIGARNRRLIKMIMVPTMAIWLALAVKTIATQ